MNTDKNISVFALTGGECCGKSSALAYLQEKLTERGFEVYVVPEVASELFSSGITFRDKRISLAQFQKLVLGASLQKEDLRKRAATMSQTSKHKVIITDRGALDGAVFIGKEPFRRMAREMGWSLIGLQARYNAVFHLVTAAEGAEAFYTRKNNRHRIQTPAQARAMDRALRRTYAIAREHMHVIDNSTNFKDKLKRLLQKVHFELGIPEPLEIERRFLVKRFSLKNLPAGTEYTDIRQAYVEVTHAYERRIRSREHDQVPLHYLTEKRGIDSGISVETTDMISLQRFDTLMERRDPKRYPIWKHRYTFVWENQFFELNVFRGRHAGLFLLEIELTNRQQEVVLPPFIPIIKEVTHDPYYKNVQIALR